MRKVVTALLVIAGCVAGRVIICEVRRRNLELKAERAAAEAKVEHARREAELARAEAITTMRVQIRQLEDELASAKSDRDRIRIRASMISVSDALFRAERRVPKSPGPPSIWNQDLY